MEMELYGRQGIILAVQYGDHFTMARCSVEAVKMLASESGASSF